MPSPTYELFARAMKGRKQIHCVYDGYKRAICPIILGQNKGEEMALVYQFAGGSRSGLPPEGQWKCFRLGKARHIQLRDGPWHAGASHRQAQACVEDVDIDVNPSSPYNPRRRV